MEDAGRYVGANPAACALLGLSEPEGPARQPSPARRAGLGLAISKAVLELHGGSLSAASEGRGQGATFTARLPVYVGPQAAPASRQRRCRGG